jgi:hypothetical protein
MFQQRETEDVTTNREALISDNPFAWRLSLRDSTHKRARMLAGSGARLLETRSRRTGMPHRGLFSYSSREIARAQVLKEGDSCYATPPLTR